MKNDEMSFPNHLRQYFEKVLTKMDQWETLCNLNCQHNLIKGSKVHSHGDWSATIYRISKEIYNTRDQALADIYKEYELTEMTEQEFDRKIKPIGSMKEAMTDIPLEMEDYSAISQFGAELLDHFEIIVDDGNTKLAYMNNAMAHYCIFYETS